MPLKEKPLIFINSSQGHAFSQQLYGQAMQVRNTWVLIIVPLLGQVEGRCFFCGLNKGLIIGHSGCLTRDNTMGSIIKGLCPPPS